MLNGNKVVLLVDDDPDTLDLLRQFFYKNNYITRCADSVIVGLEKLDEAVDLVVTDYDMPIMNGADLRLMIRQKFKELPVIGISGFRFMDNDTVGRMFDAFLFKPFRISALKSSVDHLLSHASVGENVFLTAI